MTTRLATEPAFGPETAHRLHLRLVELRSQAEQAMYCMGLLLQQMRDDVLYTQLGYSTFEQYCASPDLAISRPHAYRLIDLVQTYQPLVAGPEPVVGVDDVMGMGVTKARMIGRRLQEAGPEEARELVAEAKTLSVSDLRLRLSERDGAVIDELRESLERAASRLASLAYKIPMAADPLAAVDAVSDEAMRLYSSLQVTLYRQPTAGIEETFNRG